MDSSIVAAIITASGAIISAIIGKLPVPEKKDGKYKRNEETKRKRRQQYNTISILLLCATFGLTSHIINQSKIDPVVPPVTTQTIPIASTTSAPTAEPNVDPPYVLPGTIKSFGQYEQNDQEVDGAEDIEWLVLKQDGNKLLIISMLGLELRPYAQGSDTSDWENSSIRDWLNGTFYHTAFSDEEKDNILETKIIQHKNEDYPYCDQGNDTTDKVFLLSLWEYIEYMYNNGDIQSEYRNGTPSTHVANNRNVDLSNDKYSWWWLRTSSRYNTTACRVTAYGAQDSGYKDINTDNGMIRPAMWVDATWWNELP